MINIKPILGYILIFTILASAACESSHEKKTTELDSNIIQGDLIIHHTPSLTFPLKKIFSEFNKEYPHVELISEAIGANKAAINITEKEKSCDVLIASDYTIIDQVLIPKYASWKISFATNELVLAYNDHSKLKDSINANNWYKILSQNKVKYGRADPDTDPCGYRSLICIKLAEIYYDEYGIRDQLLFKDKQYIKSKDTDLLGLLNNGKIDYAFIYKSLAKDMNIPFIELPKQINLSSDSQAGFYSQAKVKITGNQPGKYSVQKGTPIKYATTILNSTTNPKAAEAFIAFLFDSKRGAKYLKKSYLPILDSLIIEPKDSLSDDLRLMMSLN